MLNQPGSSISALKSEERNWYGNEDLSNVDVTKPPRGTKGFYEVNILTPEGASLGRFFCKKQHPNYYRQEWHAYTDKTALCAIESAYTFRNLKGMLLQRFDDDLPF